MCVCVRDKLIEIDVSKYYHTFIQQRPTMVSRTRGKQPKAKPPAAGPARKSGRRRQTPTVGGVKIPHRMKAPAPTPPAKRVHVDCFDIPPPNANDRLLGEGTYGTTVVRLLNGHKRAVKFVREHFNTHEGDILIQAAHNNPYVGAMIEQCTPDETIADGDSRKRGTIVMELLRGGRVTSDSIGRVVPSADTALRVLRQLLEGAAMMHANGVIHHDIKGDNVVFSESPLGDATTWMVKYIDFGLSCAGRVECSQPRNGTPMFMPPESSHVVLGKGFSQIDAGELHDVWSIGMTVLDFIDPSNSMIDKTWTMTWNVQEAMRASPDRRRGWTKAVMRAMAVFPKTDGWFFSYSALEGMRLPEHTVSGWDVVYDVLEHILNPDPYDRFKAQPAADFIYEQGCKKGENWSSPRRLMQARGRKVAHHVERARACDRCWCRPSRPRGGG
jgi:serine/threonine protein kinase